MNESDILAEIQAIATNARTLRPWKQGGREDYAALLKRMQALDKQNKPGLQIGRMVIFSVADGYAYYFVVNISTEIVNLEYIPMPDLYESVAVCDGKCFRKTVERTLHFSDNY